MIFINLKRNILKMFRQTPLLPNCLHGTTLWHAHIYQKHDYLWTSYKYNL